MSEFKWDNQLVEEFINWQNGIVGWFSLNPSDTLKQQMEYFKELKQKPKEWEILEGKSDNRGVHEWYPDNSHGGESCNHQGCKIHSVRRLNDGEVFSVGDMVQVIDLNCKAPITKFAIENGVLRVLGEDANTEHKFWSTINGISKTKQLLFTTEDGVEIFDENTVIYSLLTKCNWDCGSLTSGIHARHLKRAINQNSAWKYFASKENRDEYLLLNRPCLSVKEVVEQFLQYYSSRPFQVRIQEMAKSKISQP